MKPIDGDALFCKFWSLADPYVKQKKVFPSQVWNQAATMVREAPNLHTTNEMLTLEEIERAYETPALDMVSRPLPKNRILCAHRGSW